MSHFFVIVALPGDVSESDIGSAVQAALDPYRERNELFADGSRVDYGVIGGRYGARLLGRDCVRRSALTPEACANHIETRYRNYWTSFRNELSERGEADNAWLRDEYGIMAGETEDDLVARVRQSLLTGMAFVRSGTWYEQHRVGWFACQAPTECDVASGRNAGEKPRRCLWRDPSGGAIRIVSYNEPDETWKRRFYRRFIGRLPADEWIVGVDCHV